ncbi:hypothetical protein U1Q18_043120 [Sarracenia purpurea var. burkii]
MAIHAAQKKRQSGQKLEVRNHEKTKDMKAVEVQVPYMGYLQSTKRKLQVKPAGRFVPPLPSACCFVPRLSSAEKASLLSKAIEGLGKQVI